MDYPLSKKLSTHNKSKQMNKIISCVYISKHLSIRVEVEVKYCVLATSHDKSTA